MIELPRVTLVAVEGVDANLALKALKISAKQINFAKIKLLSPQKPSADLNDIEWVQITPMSYIEYNRFILFNLDNYIDTDFALTVQPDGFVLNANSWTSEFEQYDYIGAAWLPSRIMMSEWVTQEVKMSVNNNVGNGGFSLRSKKLLNATKKSPMMCDGPEDAYICLNHYRYFAEQGIKFAPQEIAHIFSKEQFDWLPNTFGFHGDKELIYDYIV